MCNETWEKIFVVCHCLLNSNAKIYPLSDTKGVYADDLAPLIQNGVGLVQFVQKLAVSAVFASPLMNIFSGLLKETSLVSVLAITELTRVGQLIYLERRYVISDRLKITACICPLIFNAAESPLDMS